MGYTLQVKTTNIYRKNIKEIIGLLGFFKKTLIHIMHEIRFEKKKKESLSKMKN
jgi:hypothetical protein